MLAATGLEDLTDRLVCLASDQEFWDREVEGRAATGERVEDLQEKLKASRLNTSSLEATLGPTATHRCEQGWEAFKAVIRHAEGFIERLQSADTTAPVLEWETAPPPRQRLTDQLYDADLPEGLRDGICLWLKFAVGMFVIARAEELRERIDPWLALGLANNWAEAPERTARLLSDSDALMISLLGLASEATEAKRLTEAFAAWEQTALRSGQPIYFPFGPDGEAE